MVIVNELIKQGMSLRTRTNKMLYSDYSRQNKQLRKLIKSAEKTKFGECYKFDEILNHCDKETNQSPNWYQEFKEKVPIFDYNKIFQEWWHKTIEGEMDVCWPGEVKYFALSSGTSGASSKRIPLTGSMLKSLKKTSLDQLSSLINYESIPFSTYSKSWLMLGGSTQLHKIGNYFEGDLSGIAAKKIPFWFQNLYKPGKKISEITDWDLKIEEITKNAHKWDIGFLVGVPSWIQILLEKIIHYYNLNSIHEIWPNLNVYIHSGVCIEPYRKNLERLFGKPVTTIETYLASEGFIAYQSHPKEKLRLVTNHGIFFEFIPFNSNNFNENGDLKLNPVTMMIDKIEEGIEYALLLSTCAGAWRYLIGDTIRIINKEKSEIVVTGRTKHFLSLCGEHLSMENMEKAIELIAEEFKIEIPEFTVTGLSSGTLFAHHWFLGSNDTLDEKIVSERLDEILCALNDDYKVERQSALKEIKVKFCYPYIFYSWMKIHGKYGGQGKFPRVLNSEKYSKWIDHLTRSEQLTINDGSLS
ncbi:MAG: GH3 auxin-responsive promoter family protein [Saprospiraceae bacterium]|nr:GH3 auxin-responsive promoter family protein [Saprospiraceae bacterium]